MRGLEVLAGRIPDDLNGVYVRNGPNPQHHPVGRYHWFDGDGMVHSVHFADGEATYRNRWVRTDGFLARARRRPRDLARHHRAVRRQPAGRAGEGHGEHRRALPPRPPARAVVPRRASRTRSTRVTLETLGPEDFGGTLRCEVSAHAKVDEAHRRADVLRLRGEAAVHALRRRRARRRRCATSSPIDLPGPAPAARHGDHRAPLDPDGPAARRRSRGGARRAATSSQFQRDLPARFGVIPRYGDADEIRWFEADPCYIYHSINAREEGDEIVLDVCRVKQPEPVPDGRRPARADAHATCASTRTCTATASTCAPARTTEQVHGRRQQRVPVDEPGAASGAPRATRTTCTSRPRRRCCSTAS